MTLARTPSTMLCTRSFSVCCETASSDSSSGNPAFTRVASWRVNSARSVADTRRAKEKLRFWDFSCSDTALTVIGSSCRSRSSWRTWRAVSPSRMPRLSRPPVSTAVYSKAPMRQLVLAGDTQDFLQRRLAAHHPRPAVVANGRGQGARVPLQFLFGGAIVNHGAHVIIDHDQLIDAAATAIAIVAVARPVQGRRRIILAQIQQPPFVIAGLEGLAVLRIQHAHQALCDHPDETGGEQEGLD